jgi:hypothetical protein
MLSRFYRYFGRAIKAAQYSTQTLEVQPPRDEMVKVPQHTPGNAHQRRIARRRASRAEIAEV